MSYRRAYSFGDGFVRIADGIDDGGVFYCGSKSVRHRRYAPVDVLFEYDVDIEQFFGFFVIRYFRGERVAHYCGNRRLFFVGE